MQFFLLFFHWNDCQITVFYLLVLFLSYIVCSYSYFEIFFNIYLVESKERFFHQFTSNFPNKNSFWQKLHRKPTLQKIPGYKDGIARNRSLWRHKGRSVKILYIENHLTYRVGAYLILGGIYVFLKTFKASATIYNSQAPKSTYSTSHIFVKSLCWWCKTWVNV